MSNDVAVTGESTLVVSVAALLKRAADVDELIFKVLKPDIHYGLIPGCKNPSLFLPGAQMLARAFGLTHAAEVTITELGGDHREYVTKATMWYKGVALATYVGTCTTKESKYRYRGGEGTPTGRPVPREYWATRDKALIGGKGFSTVKNKDGAGSPGLEGQFEIYAAGGDRIENPDIADMYNTVASMSGKRAYVGAVRYATAVTHKFTQDAEDMDLHQHSDPPPVTPAEKAAVTPPKGMSATVKTYSDLLKKYATLTYGDGAEEDQKKAILHSVSGCTTFKGMSNETAYAGIKKLNDLMPENEKDAGKGEEG